MEPTNCQLDHDRGEGEFDYDPHAGEWFCMVCDKAFYPMPYSSEESDDER